MRRRGPGAAGLRNKKKAQEKLKELGQQSQAEQVEHINQSMEKFKTALEAFAKKHKNKINKNPRFRAQFHQMCMQIGVDPLASNKGFWAQVLGVGDFYYELGVQLIDVCRRTREQNGGLMLIDELTKRLQKLRGSKSQEISPEDVYAAIKKLRNLGGGYQVVTVNGKKMVVSVPMELNVDHIQLLTLAQKSGFTSESMACAKLNWTAPRFQNLMKLLLQEGMVWVDNQTEEREYWFPSLVSNLSL